MYLYEKKDNIIYIYELIPNDDKLRKFREDELKKQENIFWYASTMKDIKRKISHTGVVKAKVPRKETDWDRLIQREFNKNKNPVKNGFRQRQMIVNTYIYENKLFENGDNEININELNNNNHFFGKTKQNFKLLLDYYSGKYDLNTIVKIYKNTENESSLGLIDTSEPLPQKTVNQRKIIQYLVLTEPCYHKNNSNIINSAIYSLKECYRTDYILDNIISIPKSLYLLHMFLQGNIKEISNENIDTQLGLFTLNPAPILTIPLEYLEKSVQCNLMKYTLGDINSVVDTHQKILKKLR